MSRLIPFVVLAVGACGRMSFDAIPLPSLDVDGSISDGMDAPRACQNFGPWGPMQHLTVISDAGSEDWGGEISRNGLRFYFSSQRSGGGDIYVASRASRTDSFTAAVPIMELNDASIQYEASVSSDELEIYVTGNFAANLGIYRATRTSLAEPFGAFQPLVDQVGSPTSGFSGASLADDDLTLYYNTRTDGEPEGTLMTATRPDRASDFGPGVPLSGLETGALKGYPWLSADGYMYFEQSSPHRQARSQRLGPNQWGAPVDVAELNGPPGTNEDVSFTPDGLEVFTASNRDVGNDDIYTAQRECLD